MLRIYITRQSRYPVEIKKIKGAIWRVLVDNSVTDAQVSVALVGERKMRELGQRYLHETETDAVHEVLSFPSLESSDGFVSRGGVPLQLGDIVICYPEVRKIAVKKNRLMDDVISELAEHGALHLLGIHHGE